MSRMFVFLLVAVAAVAAEETVAVVRLTPNNADKNVTGNLKFVQAVPNGPVVITGKIYGLSKGLHGFHVHAKGDLTSGCTSAGPHFNPDNVTHGAPEDTVRHVGDLGNIEANANGEAIINITDNIISLTGQNNILGRSIVVHAGEDDLGKGNHTLSSTTGNSGDRLACGVIGVQSPTGRWKNSGSFTLPNISTLMILFCIVMYQHHKF